MKDLRWLEDEGVDDDVRQLLRAAPVPRNMRAEERARSARALRRMTALPVAAGLMFWLKNVAIAGVLGAAGGFVVSGAVVLATNEAPAPEPAPVLESPSRAPERVPTAPGPTAITTNAATEEPSPAPALRAPSAVPSASAVADDTLASETKKLEAARTVLATDPNRALALLAAHAAEFPAGKLRGERELLAIDALGRAGRKPEARARAEAMLLRQPHGLYAERLRRMLEQLR